VDRLRDDGLDLGKDRLIEVAALVTDPDLNLLGDGVDVVIHADEVALGSMIQVVREMHDKSGLTDAARLATITVAEAEDMIMSYLTTYVKSPGPRRCAATRSPPTVASSPGTCRDWTPTCTTG
jgi:oligoribonuclease (3'-5' exoribonuclease)